jgi:FkbM family methyltransferase
MTTSELKSQGTSKRPLLDSGPFTSYSLNFEDVILHRLFPGTENGFYVDVGAGHPRFENDTFSLYERGWRGINIEPNQGFHAALMEERPRDTNIRAVLSDSLGDVLTYYELDGSGLSTCDPEQAEAYQAIGLAVVTRKFPATTLANILSEAGVTDINILKIDVEGFEEKVLASNDWERFRPDVVLVEATYPENPARRPTNIPIFMKERGYRHVHFDGLNDFYLEGGFEAPEGLSLPPNVFDRFVPHQIAELRMQVDSLSKHSKMEEYALSLEAEVNSLPNQSGADKEPAGTIQNEVELLRSQARADKEHASYLQSEIQLLGLKLMAAERHASEKENEFNSPTAKLSVAENQTLTFRSEGEEALRAADALATENRRIGYQRAALSDENRRLRGASEQMHRELMVLNQLLEPLHTLAEQLQACSDESAEWKRKLAAADARLELVYSEQQQACSDESAEWKRKLAAADARLELVYSEQQQACSDESAEWKRKLADANARLESVYSSRCWRLTAPLRWIDKVLYRVITKK